MPDSPVLLSLCQFLDSHEIRFRKLDHEATKTSEESARVRGEPLEIGGKALLLKVQHDFRLFVFSAAWKLDSAAVRARFQARKLRFATPQELADKTGLVPGSVPPFGEPILPFPLYVDTSITKNERIAFNAGSLTTSIIMEVADYLRVAQPEVFPFSDFHA